MRPGSLYYPTIFGGSRGMLSIKELFEFGEHIFRKTTGRVKSGYLLIELVLGHCHRLNA